MTDPFAALVAEAVRPVIAEAVAAIRAEPAPLPAALAGDDRVAVSPREAARLLDVSPRTVDELIRDGTLPSFPVRSCRRVRLADLRDLAARGVEADREARRPAAAGRDEVLSLIRRRQRRSA